MDGIFEHILDSYFNLTTSFEGLYNFTTVADNTIYSSTDSEILSNNTDSGMQNSTVGIVPTVGIEPMNTYKVNIFFALFLPTLCLIITLLNLITISSFFSVPKLREKPRNLLILNLSCADLLTGVIVLPLYSPAFITPDHWPLGEGGCKVTFLFLNLCVHGSLFALISISLDRLLLVYLEYHRYIVWQSYTNIYKLIAVCWFLAMTTIVFELGFWNSSAKAINGTEVDIDFAKHCLSPARRLRSFAIPYYICLYFTPVFLVCGMSIAFLRFLHRRLQNSKRLQGPIPNRQIHKRYIKPASTLFGLVLAMTICMLPYCLYVLVTEIICMECYRNLDVLYGLLFLQFCNASLDPFIYALTQQSIRKFYKKLFDSLLKQASRTHNVVFAPCIKPCAQPSPS